MVSGNFRGSGDYNPGAVTFNISSAGDQDVFVVKLDSQCDFIWAKSFGGVDREDVFSMTLDNADNIYLTGYFEGVCDFDPSASSFNLVSNGDNDIYVCKLNSSGEFQWAKGAGAEFDDRGQGIVYDQKTFYISQDILEIR